MKRFGGDGLDAGPWRLRAEKRPGSLRPTRPRMLTLVASPSSASVRAAGFEGARARDFEDFVTEDVARTRVVPPQPDPGFREGLRRRLWRIHVLRRGYRGLDRN